MTMSAFDIGLVGFGVDGVLNGFYVGTGRPEFNAYAAVVGLVITLAGDLTLITRYGLMGAAVTSAVAYTAKGLALAAIFVSLTARRPESPRVSEASRRAATRATPRASIRYGTGFVVV